VRSAPRGAGGAALGAPTAPGAPLRGRPVGTNKRQASSSAQVAPPAAQPLPRGCQSLPNMALPNMALPNMAGYAEEQATDPADPQPEDGSGGRGGATEDDKRKKRLARNRASARLRRMKKKNLVDTYEVEVGVLESSLEKLRTHQWGAGHADVLLEALSMERGQQSLPAATQTHLLREILAQQREQVANLREAQAEMTTLAWLARRGGATPGTDAAPEQKDEEEQIAKELAEVLRLTPAQQAQLQQATEGADDEYRALATIDTCLETLQDHDWLMNTGVEECTDIFSSILNPQQFNKFLIWTDHNSEAIEQLDYINAPPTDSPPSNSPIFQFGIDECGED